MPTSTSKSTTTKTSSSSFIPTFLSSSRKTNDNVMNTVRSRRKMFLYSQPSDASDVVHGEDHDDSDRKDDIFGYPQEDDVDSKEQDQDEPEPERKSVIGNPRPAKQKPTSLWEEIGGDKKTLLLHENKKKEDEGVPRFSKMRWKKKSFLMMQDVRKEMTKNRKRAPKKAEEVAVRLHQWYEYEKEQQQEESINSTGMADPAAEDGPAEDSLLSMMESSVLQAYNLYIHALARSSLPGAGYMAEDILLEMKSKGIPANVVTYTSILDAHARSPNDGGAQAAEDFLFRLMQTGLAEENLNELTCDTILNAWAQERTMESAEHAEMILLRLEESQLANVRPTPNSYATVMNAFAKVGSTQAAERAVALLARMIRRTSVEVEEVKAGRRSKKSLQKNGIVRPDTVTFNACINAWATSRDPRAGKKAMEILEQMKEISTSEDSSDFDAHPDTVTYNTVLSCWSHCGDKNAALQAERVVKNMRKISEQNSMSKVHANTVTFNTVLHAWSQSKLPNAASRAEELIGYMIQSNDPNIAPDVYSFNCVIDALSKSKESYKARRAREWLDRLHEKHVQSPESNLKPTTSTYNTVLNACAFSAQRTTQEEQREALKIAVGSFASMPRERIKRDTVTYGTMLKCFANLVPKGDVRNRMALQVFQECCEEGMVGELVWNEIRRSVPPQLIQQTCQFKRECGSMEVSDLPMEWRVNNKGDRPKPQTQEKPRRSKKTGSSSSNRRQPKVKEEAVSVKPKFFLIEKSFSSDKDMIF
ncbi:PPR: pentatricopeptide repeat domain containing protein [Nitzschia inconspicua]|uniref:PPR: pentatricopeptide repeat domain containing protein n=1 Tax=Nitzschia inconspicua TaxID=303405 RepID=A0A9K3KX99_9STRA|nr:PPR: pentatricopeptide repeat domain containing protein [Nitzschia inconspicua]